MSSNIWGKFYVSIEGTVRERAVNGRQIVIRGNT